MHDWLQKLQNQSQQTKLKVLWSTVAAAAIVLVVIVSLSIKSSVKNVDGQNPFQAAGQTAGETLPNRDVVKVESIDSSAAGLKIYFNIENDTDDILNVPDATNIQLAIGGQILNPTAIDDRQSGPFVKKVLSHTQDFGVLVFAPAPANRGTLNFNQMFFEQSPNNLFQQQLDLDFQQLTQPVKPRN